MNTSEGESPNTEIPNLVEIVIEPANPRRTPIDELQGLARRIRRKSNNTTVRFAYYEPEEGKYGITWAEIIRIWLPRMADAVEGALIIEVVKQAVKWARKRIRKGSKSPKYIYIHSADGKLLREIKINNKKQDPDIIFPTSSDSFIRKRPPLHETACSDFRYALIMIRISIKKLILAVRRSPQNLSTAIQRHKENTTKRRAMQMYKEATKTVEIQRRLKELALTKILSTYNRPDARLKRNAIYGNANHMVHFEIAFENEEGIALKLVHIYCAKQGSIKTETGLYAEALAAFQEKLKAYRRLVNHGVRAVYVLVVPRKESGRYPYVDVSLFNKEFGYEGWLFNYKELGYKNGFTV